LTNISLCSNINFDIFVCIRCSQGSVCCLQVSVIKHGSLNSETGSIAVSHKFRTGMCSYLSQFYRTFLSRTTCTVLMSSLIYDRILKNKANVKNKKIVPREKCSKCGTVLTANRLFE